MRITILTQYYPPETGAPQARLSDLAVRLGRMGHRVQVLTALPNYPGTAVYPGWEGRANQTEVVDGVRVTRLSLYVPQKRTFSRRMANYLSFAGNVLREGRRLLEPSDVVLMETPPLFLGLAAVPLANSLGARLVVNVSDLWPRTAVEIGIVTPGLGLAAAEMLEAWLYRSAALVTGQTEGILEDIRSRFPSIRTRLFPNGVDCETFSPSVDPRGIREELGWDADTVVFGYTGVLGYAQALDQVLAAAERLSKDRRITIALIGDGPEKERLAAAVARQRLPNVKIHPRQPRERMPALQAAIDVGLVPLADRKVFEGARPSKMFEIMASGRPVLLCARGEAVSVLESAPGGAAGLAVPPEEPVALAAAIERLASNPDLRAELGRRGRALVESRYERAEIAEQVSGYLAEA